MRIPVVAEGKLAGRPYVAGKTTAERAPLAGRPWRLLLEMLDSGALIGLNDLGFNRFAGFAVKRHNHSGEVHSVRVLGVLNIEAVLSVSHAEAAHEELAEERDVHKSGNLIGSTRATRLERENLHIGDHLHGFGLFGLFGLVVCYNCILPF